MDSSLLDSNDRGVVRSTLAGFSPPFSSFRARPGMDRSQLCRGRSLHRCDYRHLLMLARDGAVLANRYRSDGKNAADFQRTISHCSAPHLHAFDSSRSRYAGDNADAGDAGDCHRTHRMPAIRGAPGGNLSPRKTWPHLRGLYETRGSISTAHLLVRDS